MEYEEFSFIRIHPSQACTYSATAAHNLAVTFALSDIVLVMKPVSSVNNFASALKHAGKVSLVM